MKPSTFAIFFASLLGLAGCATPPSTDQSQGPAATPSQRIADWRALIETSRSSKERDKLQAVNQFFNRLDFVDDALLWGKEDYWATPVEMLTKKGGDCEDFTVAKYFTLRELDVPENRLRLTYVKSLGLNQPHMVLTYYVEPKSDPLVLDNLSDTIVTASERPDLIPVYSFNASGLWLAKQQSDSPPLNDGRQLTRWQTLQRRLAQEGLLPASQYSLSRN